MHAKGLTTEIFFLQQVIVKGRKFIVLCHFSPSMSILTNSLLGKAREGSFEFIIF